MLNSLPKKIIDSIEKDLKKEYKAKKQPWPGFGPVVESYLSADGVYNERAIVVWKQGSSETGTKTNFMVGTYEKIDGAWSYISMVPANYDSSSNVGVEAKIRQWKNAA